MPIKQNNEENTTGFDLARFIEAQEKVYTQVIAELGKGEKRSHWMWFIFPQVDGLGTSATAKKYAIKSVEEAKAYAQHPLLGQRLLECCYLLLATQDKTATEILGTPDDHKLQSCMTLFAKLIPEESVYVTVLVKFYGGKIDPRTIIILKEISGN